MTGILCWYALACVIASLGTVGLAAEPPRVPRPPARHESGPATAVPWVPPWRDDTAPVPVIREVHDPRLLIRDQWARALTTTPSATVPAGTEPIR